MSAQLIVRPERPGEDLRCSGCWERKAVVEWSEDARLCAPCIDEGIRVLVTQSTPRFPAMDGTDWWNADVPKGWRP